jgi:glycine cleavage system H protein
VGTPLRKGAAFGAIESVKAVSDLCAPISGEVVAVNEELAESPEKVNEDPHGAGWLFRLRPTSAGDLEGLMSAEAYEEFIQQNA